MIEQRLTRLETDMAEVKSILARLAPKVDEMFGFLQATLPTLATKADLAGVQAVTPTLATKADLAEKPSRGHLWAALGVTWAIALGVAALMVDLLR